MMCEELSTAIGPPPCVLYLSSDFLDSMLKYIQPPERGVGPQRSILPYLSVIKKKLSVWSKPVNVV
jgi:hypothetical protein